MKTKDSELEFVALAIKKLILEKRKKNRDIFLCGADQKNEQSTRSTINNIITKNPLTKSNFIIHYPEKLFDKSYFTETNFDFVTLELLLAESVDYLIVVPESPGSFVELGMFTSDSRIIKKLICIQEEKFKIEPSFINTGPIRLLNKIDKRKVFYYNQKPISTSEISELIEILKKLDYKNKLEYNLFNLEIISLLCIKLLKETDINFLNKIISHLNAENKLNPTLFDITIKELIRKHSIETFKNNEDEENSKIIARLNKNGEKILTSFGDKSFSSIKQDKIRLTYLYYKNKRNPNHDWGKRLRT